MSIYDDISKEREVSDELSEHDTLKPVIDDLFETFKSVTEWPDDKLQFASIQFENEIADIPSKVLAEYDKYRFGVCAIFSIPNDSVKMPFFIGWLGGLKYRINYGPSHEFESNEPNEIERAVRSIAEDVRQRFAVKAKEALAKRTG